MTMSFYGLWADGETLDYTIDQQVTLSKGNAAWVLQTLGFKTEDGYFEANIDEFIGATLIVPVRGPTLAQDYLTDAIRRLNTQASGLKARGAVKIYGA